MVGTLVFDHLRNAGRPSSHFARRIGRNRDGHWNVGVEKEANICAMVRYFHSAMRMGHCYNARHIRIRLFYNCKPVADVHEGNSTLRYQTGRKIGKKIKSIYLSRRFDSHLIAFNPFAFTERFTIVASVLWQIRYGCAGIGVGRSFAAQKDADNSASTQNIHHLRNNDTRILDDCANILWARSYVVGGDFHITTILEWGRYGRISWQRFGHLSKFFGNSFRIGQHGIVDRWLSVHLHRWNIDIEKCRCRFDFERCSIRWPLTIH